MVMAEHGLETSGCFLRQVPALLGVPLTSRSPSWCPTMTAASLAVLLPVLLAEPRCIPRAGWAYRSPTNRPLITVALHHRMLGADATVLKASTRP
jgi:hypothetical protein